MGGWEASEGPAAGADSGKLLTTITTLCAVIWLAIYPLLSGFTYTRITEDKAIIALALFFVTVVMMGTAIWHTRGSGRRLTLPMGLLLGLGAWLILSALFGTYAGTLNQRGLPAVLVGMIRHEGVLTQLAYLCLFWLFAKGQVSLRPLVTACGISQLLFLAVVLMQYAGLNPLYLFPAGKSTMTNYEFQGTIGNIDMISGYLCMMIPLTLGGYVLGMGGKLALLGGTGSLFLMACMGVQGGLLTLGFGVLLLLLTMMWLPQIRRRGLQVLGWGCLAIACRQLTSFPWLDHTERLQFPYGISMTTLVLMILGAVLLYLSLTKWRIWEQGGIPFGWSCLITAVLVGGMVTALLLMPLSPEANGLYEIRETLLGRGQDAFGSYRMGVWRHALALARENLLFGGGTDTFMTALSQRLADTGEALPELFDNAHNEYLNLAANNGFPALLLYLAAMITLLLTGRRSREKGCLAAVVLMYMAQAFFSFSIIIVAPMFWVAAGLCAAASRHLHEPSATPATTAEPAAPPMAAEPPPAPPAEGETHDEPILSE